MRLPTTDEHYLYGYTIAFFMASAVVYGFYRWVDQMKQKRRSSPKT